MVKAIIFDFWGTLVENGVWSPIKQVKNILNIKLPFPEYVVRMEKAMMTSKVKDLKSAFVAVCKEFKLEVNEEKLGQLVGIWNKSWMLAHPYDETIETLKKLKEKYKVILVANTDNFSIEQVIGKFNMEELFDQMFFSYNLGIIKTDENFFKQVLSEMNLNAEDCVVVGDSVQSDVVAAKKGGIKAILIDRRNSRDYHPKIKTLMELEPVLEI
jgi:HAD superfamily hydrolase (TIGR01549 family)